MIVILPKSSSVVGFVTAGGAVYVGGVVEPNIKFKDVALPEQIVDGVAVAVAV